MNIRISSDSVRIRVNLDEAHVLREHKTLSKKVSFPEGFFLIEALVVENQDEALKFLFSGWSARVVLRESDFLVLLNSNPSKESGIKAILKSVNAPAIEVVFEIDLFSKKNTKRGQS